MVRWRLVSFPGPEVDLRTIPSEFDSLVDWLERWSCRLVLLEEYPISDLRTALRTVERAVREHRVLAESWERSLPGVAEEVRNDVTVLLSDHVWFETSLEQFWWFFRVVEKEDHGGNRQALGQYGRVLAESLARHLLAERRLEPPHRPAEAAPPPEPRETLIR